MSAEILVNVEELHRGQRVPVRFGVPWPRSELTGSGDIRVLSDSGEVLASQYTVLERWPDSSVKWALIDAMVPVADSHASVHVESVSGSSVAEDDSATVPDHDEGFTFSGESIEVSVEKSGGAPVLTFRSKIDKGGAANTLTALLTDLDGREWSPRIETIKEIRRGPVCRELRLAGSFDRQGDTLPINFEMKIDLFNFVSGIALEIDLWNPQAAKHYGNIWDLGDSGSFCFRDFTLNVQSGAAAKKSHCRLEKSSELSPVEHDAWTLHQDSSGGENWNSQNHVNAEGKLTVSFRGYRCIDQASGEIFDTGNRATPVVVLEQDKQSVGVSVDGFWQNFPGALRVDSGSVEVGLFPSETSAAFELQGGERKRQSLTISVGPDVRSAYVSSQLAHRVLALPDPAWIEQSNAIPWFTAGFENTKTAACRDYVESVVQGPESFSARREVIDEYGWRNYGDLYADHEAVRETSPGTLISHYNNQYDFVYGAAVQALRCRDARWYEQACAAARHHVDIDIYHTDRDRPAYNHGMFWHTEHYRSAATATHRTYSIQNKESKGFGGGPSNEHNYSSGLNLYYFLTGDATARNALIGLGNWVIAMDDPAGTLWSIVDSATPTGLASRTVFDDYHGPGRGAGNSINALIDAYALTQERSYIEKAESLIRRCINPDDDIDSLNLDEPEYRWSYLVFLQVLGKYLWKKEELEEIDYTYQYARDSLLHYAEWMFENERPYKELLDKVDLPTETWPAQDIRKAHVFYIASDYCRQDRAEGYRQKADFYFDRCLSDLLEFETAYLCRPRVLLTVYGFVRDYYDADKKSGARRLDDLTRKYDYGRRSTFVPQRARLAAALRSRLHVLRRELQRLVMDKLAASGRGIRNAVRRFTGGSK